MLKRRFLDCRLVQFSTSWTKVASNLIGAFQAALQVSSRFGGVGSTDEYHRARAASMRFPAFPGALGAPVGSLGLSDRSSGFFECFGAFQAFLALPGLCSAPPGPCPSLLRSCAPTHFCKHPFLAQLLLCRDSPKRCQAFQEHSV